MIIAAAQTSPLFGVAYDASSNKFKEYEPKGVNPFSGRADPMGFLKVFDNSNGEFDGLREKLYAANGSGVQSSPAFYQQTLKVVENQLRGVEARSEPVTILWVQNAQVNDWQSQIEDDDLKGAIVKGQQEGGLEPFTNFPYYNTFTKIHLSAAETNTLAQMWAWCVADPGSPLSAALTRLLGISDPTASR